MTLAPDETTVASLSGRASTRRGILTIATGRRPYIRQAISLGYSLERHCPRIPRAVISDSDDPTLHRLYTHVIEPRPDDGDGLALKLHVEQYTPFEETIFLDSDVLVVKDLSFVWDLVNGASFGYTGGSIKEGFWYADIPTLLKRIGLPSLPKLNTGYFYFRKDDVTRNLFERAREVHGQYHDFGFRPFKNSKSDEPSLAVALGEAGIAPVPDEDRATMYTPIGIEGRMNIDVLDGYCSFVKQGETVHPSIVHFVSWVGHPTYLRERVKLKFHNGGPLLRPWARSAGGAAYAVRWMRRRLGRLYHWIRGTDRRRQQGELPGQP